MPAANNCGSLFNAEPEGNDRTSSERYREHGSQYRNAGKRAADIGEVSASGKVTDYTLNTVAHYKRTIESLQKVIASLEARD